MDGSKYRQKGYGMAMAGASKKLAYILLLLLALTAAALSVVVLHKVGERHAFAVLLRERDRQLVSTRILLQRDKAFNKEMKRKLEELKATTSSLRTQKTDLKTKIKGLEALSTNLKNKQRELEAALTEKNSHINELEAALTEKNSHINELEATLTVKNIRINQMEEKGIGPNPDQMAALMELLQRKEAELEEIKVRFQDNRITERKGVSSKINPVQTNNANATADNLVADKVTSSSDATPTTEESKHPKDRSLEEKRLKSTANMEDDGLQDKPGDAIEDIDEFYGESHAMKPENPHRNKRFLINSRVDSHEEELYGIEQSGNYLDQDSDSVRYNKLLEKENGKVSDETKNKKNIDDNLEKISKHSLSDANQVRWKQSMESKAGAADVKPNVSVNEDGAQQQNKRHKKKKTKSKKKTVVVAASNDDGEVTKEKKVDATSVPE
ncbi:hypothetical protein GUJ93_ZPchr0010g9846 [Zizania palustris]|uniref:Uncharacterized protein n=1 Tax=Zizania palustris TaxID=103762 RepID=A0A8J6BF16_ZIZPA|nr:hypothetical protein GUJ93_ZPchr0010g9846 [Zizania palustris]